MHRTGTRGRPRSEEARQSVLEAALRLCHEHGYSNLTMKGIADAAGVGRQTVYRWWPAKSDVLFEALAELIADRVRIEPDTGDALADLREHLRVTFDAQQLAAPPLVGLMAEAQRDERVAAQLQSQILAPRRAVLRDVLQRGVDRGQLSPSTDLGLVVELIFGTMWYRLLSRHAPVDPTLADQLTTIARHLLSPAKRS